MDGVRVLILGEEGCAAKYRPPGNVELIEKSLLENESGVVYDLVILERNLWKEEIEPMFWAVKPYCLFLSERVALSEETSDIVKSKKGRILSEEQLQALVTYDARNFFPDVHGGKESPADIGIANAFGACAKWNGNYSVELHGNYGETYHQVIFWRNNVPFPKGQCMEIWLEYEKDEQVFIQLSIRQYVRGSIEKLQQMWEVDETYMGDLIRIENPYEAGELYFSLSAKGVGALNVIGLHCRNSRRGYGNFLPGGERYVTSGREELFCYFDPGDLKPPLNVYFGKNSRHEGFGDFKWVRNAGCPFLLITESRLESGAFYLGTEEYETMLVGAIQKYMDELGFSAREVIFSGIAMGAFGALYYGCDIRPYALLLGKPLANLGDVAANERIQRPGGFAASLDILRLHAKDMDAAAIERLNKRFWDKFDGTDWGNCKFLISYMMEEDCDAKAYKELLAHLDTEGVRVFGKGFHGRNRDCVKEVDAWFQNQYHKLLEEDFHRG